MHLLRTCALFLATAAPALAQARFPTEDAQGRELIRPETLETALYHQQVVIYLLIGVLVLTLGALLWLGFAFLRMQYTVERVAEAVRRVDLLSEAFRSVSVEWDRQLGGKGPGSKGADVSGEVPLPYPPRSRR